MHDYNWIGFLIPLAVLVFAGINRISKGAQDRAVGVPPPQAEAPPPIVDLRQEILRRRAAPAAAPQIQRYAPVSGDPLTIVLPSAGFPAASVPQPVAGPERPILQSVFGDPDHARRAIILAEILGPPVALRSTSPTRTAF